ncbi:MAG TPA: hypothetical protein VKO16_04550, partial [Polyangia bacterium]|nr:hypothetical protein [Polyangia bacterium]
MDAGGCGDDLIGGVVVKSSAQPRALDRNPRGEWHKLNSRMRLDLVEKLIQGPRKLDSPVLDQLRYLPEAD